MLYPLNIAKQFINRALRPFPRTEVFIKSHYLFAKFVMAKFKCGRRRRETNLFSARSVSCSKAHTFFGYYDKSPWDVTGRYFLYHEVPFANRMPLRGERALIKVADLQNDGEARTIGDTTTWNWQQGSMLQWIGNSTKQLILHNDFRNRRYVAVIRSLDNKIEKNLSLPVYCVSADGKQGLSVDFGRLHALCPGYGYVATPFSRATEPHPADDGIYHLDLETGESRLIISLADIVSMAPREDFRGAMHYFNHLEFNPGATRFVFYHRWQCRRMGEERTRMFTARPDGTDLYLLADFEMVSHFAWKGDTHLLAWANHPSLGQGYYLFEDRTDCVEDIGKGILTEDGHPSYSSDHRWILTDTYPNIERLRTLILFDTKTSRRYDIGHYFAPFRINGPIRCDLHPRWNQDGQQICFDSTHHGKRQIYIMDVGDIVDRCI